MVPLQPFFGAVFSFKNGWKKEEGQTGRRSYGDYMSAMDNSILNDSSSPDSRRVENISLRLLADNISTDLATIQ